MPRDAASADLSRCLAAVNMNHLRMLVACAPDGTRSMRLVLDDSKAIAGLMKDRERFAGALIRLLSSLEIMHPQVELVFHVDGRIEQSRADIPDGMMPRAPLDPDVFAGAAAPLRMPAHVLDEIAARMGPDDHAVTMECIGTSSRGLAWQGVLAASMLRVLSLVAETDANQVMAARLVVHGTAPARISPRLASALGRTGADLHALERLVARPLMPREPEVLHVKEIAVTGTIGLGRLATLARKAALRLERADFPEAADLAERLAGGRLAVFFVDHDEPVHLSLST